MDSMIENFKTIPPCKARIVMMPNRHIHSACFEIRPIAETLCGGNLSTLSKRFSEHLVKRMEKMQENEQKLLQSLITQSSVYAKGVLN
jgi:cystathionine beta-lyase/cystathionine gamma-synthase